MCSEFSAYDKRHKSHWHPMMSCSIGHCLCCIYCLSPNKTTKNTQKLMQRVRHYDKRIKGYQVHHHASMLSRIQICVLPYLYLCHNFQEEVTLGCLWSKCSHCCSTTVGNLIAMSHQLSCSFDYWIGSWRLHDLITSSNKQSPLWDHWSKRIQQNRQYRKDTLCEWDK